MVDSPSTPNTRNDKPEQPKNGGVCPPKLKLPENKQSITIMLLGETGSGKTAFMSLLLNLFRGHGPLELKDLHDSTTDSGLNSSCSQTTKATLYTYEVRGERLFTVQILDTPGLADSRGLDQEKENQRVINEAIKDHTPVLDAVMIMANGTTERLSAATDYTLNTLMALFPRSILDNIGIIFTHVDPLTSNFKENSLPLQLQGVKRWHIQNPLALLTNHNSHAQNANYGVEESSEVVDTIKHTHQKTISTLNRWLEWINCRTVQPTTEIIKLYEAGSEILTHINAMIADSAELSKKYQELEEIEAEMQSNKKDQNRWNDRLRQILQQKPGWTTEKTESWNTICWEPDCHSNCHIDCNENGFWCSIGWMCEQFSLQGPQVCMVAGLAAAVAAYGDVEDAMSMGSAASSEISVLSNCSSCNHPVDSHKRSQRKHVEGRPDLARFVSADDASRTEGNRLEASRTLIATELEAIRNQITHNFTSIQESTEKFRSLSLNCHFADHLVSTKRLLEVRKKALRPGPGFEDHVKSIDESIEKLEQQLKVLRSPPTFNPKEKETV